MSKTASIILGFFLTILLAGPAFGQVLAENTRWSGTLEIDEDILVPDGVTLSIEAGTVVKFKPSESTRIDPEYMSHQIEILVRGVFSVEGTADRRVILSSNSDSGENNGRWAGIIVDGGRAIINHTDLSGAEAGLTVINGRALLNGGSVRKNRYGLVAQGKPTALEISDTVIEKNDYGVMVLNGAGLERDARSVIADNAKSDLFRADAAGTNLPELEYEAVEGQPLSVTYGDEALPNYTVWKGRVLIEGQLRLPAEGRLIIMPGTIVEFTKKDTNNDGIGENGLQIQGLLIAKGTPDKPIVFRSAEENPNMGDWDAINILGSDFAQNLIEYCLIENAYRGLHFHYSNVAVNKTLLRHNYRGAQFQESLVCMTNNRFYRNKSGIQTRDSELVFNNNEVFDNLNGANFFRLNLKAADNVFCDNFLEGLRIREGTSVLERNLFGANRMGLLVSDAVYGSFDANIMSGNLESGLQIRNSDNIEITGSAIQGNSLNGINILESRAAIRGNLINANGERGIGIISFDGIISGNNIVDNGIYAIGLEGDDNIDARSNWWGDSDLDKEIYDFHDDPGLGRIDYSGGRTEPVPFSWPLAKIENNSIWAGIIRVEKMLTVSEKTVLEVKPGATVRFADPESGLLVNGVMKAKGEESARIAFTSEAGKGASDWLGIQLERAVGSEFSYSDISYADYGLHMHFVPMEITGCRFLNNNLGIRFRSGPVKLSRSLFTGNRIGIRAFRGNMEIFENEFRNNEIAVFVREGGSGIRIHHNNFIGNERYNLRLGDFDKEDVDARENWWGTDSPEEMIFDKRRETYIGLAEIEPFLDAPLKLNIPQPPGGPGGEDEL